MTLLLPGTCYSSNFVLFYNSSLFSIQILFIHSKECSFCKSALPINVLVAGTSTSIYKERSFWVPFLLRYLQMHSPSLYALQPSVVLFLFIICRNDIFHHVFLYITIIFLLLICYACCKIEYIYYYDYYYYKNPVKRRHATHIYNFCTPILQIRFSL